MDDDIEQMRRLDFVNGLYAWVQSHVSLLSIVGGRGRCGVPRDTCRPFLFGGDGATSASPKTFRRTASVEMPDWAQSADRSKKNRSPAIRSSLKANWMKTGSSARRPLGITPNRSPVMVICTVPQQISVS